MTVSSSHDETRQTLRALQGETLPLTLPFVAAGGFILLLAAERFPDPADAGLTAVALLVLPLLVLALRNRCYPLAAWLLVAGCLAAGWATARCARFTPALCLLAFPIGLAATFIGIGEAIGTAAACSAVLLAFPSARLGDLRQGIATVVALWMTLGVVWVTRRMFSVALHWYWSSYEQSRTLLEETRDAQAQLKQALEDLAEANLQLTRMNRLAQGLRQAADEARKAKEEFVANVSHELRTPLNMIVGFSQMLLRAPEVYGVDLPQNLLADLEVIHRNGQHLSKLIDDVLDLSQIESGHLALVRERVSMASIVDAAVIAVRPLFDSKGLPLEVEIAPDLPLVFCDPTRIRQVILNLLSNAGRFTEHGHVQVRVWREGPNVTVSVSDSGPGIAAQAADKVFQPFQQLDSSLRRRYGGSGLGLSISKHFIEMHGGRIWFESEEGRGTTFFFTLPIDPPAADEESAARWFSPYQQYEPRTRPPRVPHPPIRPRLVVVESGNALQRILSRYLDGTEIVGATNLEEAYQVLAQAPAQALLLNEASLSEAFERLERAGPVPYDTPTLLCSVPGAHEAAVHLGVADYLIKPILRETLLDALDRLAQPIETILVVDDEPDVQRLFRRMLLSAGRGYRILRASDGQEALEVLQEHRVDVILLDLVMPNMDGFQFLVQKNRDPALSPIPTIVVSARDPAGQPIVSNALAVRRDGGLSLSQLVACVEAITRILAPNVPGHARASPAAPGA